ncbi:MAG: molybdopterin converting factor subunit 1, partial [Anaerolineaceae bacterium]|nr:molybdopterin converting factor subunit 1 [Anaerolineaceae bacterium]
MRANVLFFANLKDRAGRQRLEVELPAGACVEDLKQHLMVLFPDLEVLLESTLVSVNQQYAMDADLIPEGAEVALFPPVSGGAASPT